jgi:hypothetical protein
LCGYENGRQTIRYLTVLLAALLHYWYLEPLAQQHTLTGDIRVHKGFHSKLLNNDRDLVVYLPPAEATKSTLCGLYLHDGQNLLTATSFIPGQEWRVDETAQR